MKLHPIHIREDRKNFIIEDKVTCEFFEMPAICIHAIKMIEQGIGLFEIETELKAVYPQEEVNLLEFAQQLIDMELIEEVDGQPLGYVKNTKEVSGFMWIPERFGKFFFNQYSILGYILLFFINVGILIINPQLFPHYKDLFVFDVMVFNILLYMGLSFIMVLFHEFGHVLAMRAEGLSSKIEIGHRLFLVVLETDMSIVWSLPVKKRNKLYLAGISFDILMLFMALITSLFLPSLSGIALGIVGIIVYDVIIRLIYQCCIYMKTDLYFVFENWSGCYNLIENVQKFFKGVFTLNKKDYNKEIFEGEKPVVITYGIFYLLGMAITLTLFLVYYIPQIIYLIRKSVPGFGMSYTSIQFWDAVMVMLQLLLGIGLLFYSWRKSYKLRYK
ncbi:membrane-associated Zn-dependent protease 1 [Bacillus sp. 1NLA3E]|nr:membrane-associated Zn-dependent protease 1 [Bacillus sp. 1NLA3E]